MAHLYGLIRWFVAVLLLAFWLVPDAHSATLTQPVLPSGQYGPCQANWAAGYACPMNYDTLANFQGRCLSPNKWTFIGGPSNQWQCSTQNSVTMWYVGSSSPACPSGYYMNATTGLCEPTGGARYNCTAGASGSFSIPEVDVMGAPCLEGPLSSSAMVCASGYAPKTPTMPTVDSNGCPITPGSASLTSCSSAGMGTPIICNYTATETGSPSTMSASGVAAAAAASAAAAATANTNGTVSIVSGVAAAAGQAATAAAQAASAAGADVNGQAAAANAAAQAVVNAATGQTQNPMAQFCMENPKANICKQSDPSSFSDVCSASPTPSCTGDAIQCAIAAATFASECALFQQYVSDHASSDIGTAAIAGTDTGNTNNPANTANRTSTDMSTLVSAGTPRWSRVGLSDVTFNTGTNYSVTLPFSKLNTPLSTIGEIGVGLTLLIALFIIFM